jgi:hypothetical protein
MIERTKLSAQDIESRCLVALKLCEALRDTACVKIRPHKGADSWTWEIETLTPPVDFSSVQWKTAGLEAVRRLQQEYDLAN